MAGKRAGVYVRISRDREGTEVGVARQEADCRKLAEQRGWDVVAVYSDNDVSASNSKRVRKAYRRILSDLESGELDAIVEYSSSRFYRRVRELDELIDRHVLPERLELLRADETILAARERRREREERQRALKLTEVRR